MASGADGTDSVVRDGDYVVFHTSDDRWNFAQVKRGNRVSLNSKRLKVDAVIGCEWGSVFSLGRNKAELIREIETVSFDTELHQLSEELHTVSNGAEARDENEGAEAEIDEELEVVREDRHDEAGKVSLKSADLIELAVRSNVNFEGKSLHARKKFIMRKHARLLLRVRILKPTGRTLCNVYCDRNPHGILGMRLDTFSLVLTLANVRADGHYMVMDHALGLLVGSVAQRMRGHGKVFSVFQGSTPACVEMIRSFNLSAEETNSIRHVPIHFLPSVFQDAPDDDLPLNFATARRDPGSATDQEQRSDVKRARLLDGSHPSRLTGRPTARRMKYWLRAGCESLIIAARHDALPLVHAMLPFLASSGNLVVFGNNFQPMAELQYALSCTRSFARIQLHETSLVHHQVLPGRSHPKMSELASGGYVLSATKLTAS
ncbi:tRNA (adenine(58)-N(1))-methyltransferase non-catalytic subunit trm6 [Porphyridium purpureum]|uniref:tRNA (adenine(58)-N(1))-methyltransferase non-catalytic subunit TRM6 n=1 Tax=Porphyridium purpureum TaxID=35688 RepID=A0A5J4YQR8_PORPP|nr:tRNA (adenine(58)-N(1))-methyltransferase non-catalytic subunit trm6 [Porphyridium purpureum]|eukprot:POR3133..scf236_6